MAEYHIYDYNTINCIHGFNNYHIDEPMLSICLLIMYAAKYVETCTIQNLEQPLSYIVSIYCLILVKKDFILEYHCIYL